MSQQAVCDQVANQLQLCLNPLAQLLQRVGPATGLLILTSAPKASRSLSSSLEAAPRSCCSSAPPPPACA
eukprot:7371459-Alexandrium_andersonii.AAC.1